MKSTEHFKHTIETYLRDRAETDELFAVSFSNPDKNMDDCCTYILNCVKQSGCNGFADEEIYSMAVHYYDEDNIDIGNPVNCQVVVNHIIELTEEEKQQAHKEARQRVQNEAYAKLTQTTKRVKQPETANQQSLFNF